MDVRAKAKQTGYTYGVTSHRERLLQLIPNLSFLEGSDIVVTSPGDGSQLATLKADTVEEVQAKIAQSVEAFKQWRTVPGPGRGEGPPVPCDLCA